MLSHPASLSHTLGLSVNCGNTPTNDDARILLFLELFPDLLKLFLKIFACVLDRMGLYPLAGSWRPLIRPYDIYEVLPDGDKGVATFLLDLGFQFTGFSYKGLALVVPR